MQIEGDLLDGDVVWLQAGRYKFMGIYTQAETATTKTTLVLHGLGAHPDWPQVIQPLRVGLIEQGFNTLSIQLPILANDKETKDYVVLFPEAAERIALAVQYLKNRKLSAEVLLAHSLGSAMGAYYLGANKHPFKRFIGVGMPAMVAGYLPKIHIPVLDLYGEDDIESVLSSVEARKKAGGVNYTQLKAANTDHFFNDQEELLLKLATQWLNKN